MGWNGGTSIARQMTKCLVKEVPDEPTRLRIYEALYDALSGNDWSNLEESTGVDPLWDKMLGYE